jgi:hypothetical protein
MRRFELIAIGLILGLARAACAPAGETRKPAEPGPPTVPATPAPATEPGKPMQLASSDLGGLNALLPIGKSARKVVVPSIDEEGILTSVTRMGKITRIDEDHFALENVVLTSFDNETTDPATGKPETTVVKVSKGVYIASEKKLVSDRPAHISRPRLEMVGESLIYWSVEGHAILKGHTELILTDPDTPTSTQGDDASSPTPPPGSPEKPDDEEPAGRNLGVPDKPRSPSDPSPGPKAPRP